MPDAPANVLCFGEILWDFLPDGAAFPGGAPFNVAYHLRRLGAAPVIVSAVGRDELGEKLLRRLEAWSIATEGIARHAELPTGVVRATIGANGDARYAIATGVAWDRIEINEPTLRAAAQAQALVFGSLAQRSPENQAALHQLLDALPRTAQRVFDVNLRPPHDDLDVVRRLAKRAEVLKLNADEAARLTGIAVERPEAQARALQAGTGCAVIVITSGARGAGLLRDERWKWEAARPVLVADTVGAGDAFLAALVAQLLTKIPDDALLARACRLGEWVASQRGATPEYTAATPTVRTAG
jgi:fructokinase